MKEGLCFLYCFATAVLFSQNYAMLVTQSTYSFGVTHQQKMFVDENGTVLYRENESPQLGEHIFPMREGLGRIKQNEKFGFIDAYGKVQIPVMYDKAEDFRDGLAAVKIDGKWGYINKKNEVVIKPIYERVMKFSNGCAIYGRGSKYGYLNTEGKEITQAIFDRVCHFQDNKAWVLLNGKWGCINTKGEMIIDAMYKDTQDFSEGYAWVEKDLLWGMIDSSNTYIIQPNERNALVYAHSGSVKNFGKLKDNRMLSKSNGKIGFSDRSLKKVIPSAFTNVFDFKDGYAIVETDHKWGVITVSGDFIIKPIYKHIDYLGFGFFAAETKGLWVLINPKGEITNPNAYVSIAGIDKIK